MNMNDQQGKDMDGKMEAGMPRSVGCESSTENAQGVLCGMGGASRTGFGGEAAPGGESGVSAHEGVIGIEVRGNPAPQGSKSFKGMTKSGRAILAESSKKVKPWRLDVKFAAEQIIQELGLQPMDGPLMARMVFTLPKPKSAPKRKTTYPMRTPDVSKLLRSTEDALTDAGLWADDARVIDYTRLAKVFPGEDPESLPCPGAVIYVWQKGLA